MNNMLEYKGYYGTVDFSISDNILFGKIVGVQSLISYEGDSIQSLQEDFRQAIDDYLEMCAENNVQAEKTYKGNFNVRISPELHKNLALFASSKGQTLNATVEEAIKNYVTN